MAWKAQIYHYNVLQRLVWYEVIKRIPKIIRVVPKVCNSCLKGKQHKEKHQKVPHVQILELLGFYTWFHWSYANRKHRWMHYVPLCVNEVLRYTSVKFLRDNFVTFEDFKKLCRSFMNEKGQVIGMIKKC